MTPKPKKLNDCSALEIMERVDSRVVTFANPVPSREEWEALKSRIQQMAKED